MPEVPQTLGRVPVEETILGLPVTVIPLAFSHSQPLLPDVMRFVTKAAGLIGMVAAAGVKGTDDIKKLLTFLPQLDPETMGFLLELLNRHSHKILSTTTVVMPHPMTGALENFELGKDQRKQMVFDEHPEAYVPIAVFAGLVTFKRFFPASGQAAGETPAAES